MRCPVCKADNADDVTACRRCKADLSLLVDLERRRAALIARAERCLATGDGPGALPVTVEADHLRSDDDSRRLVALARLMSRDFAGAWQVVSDLRSG
jgi:hypothetical protein